MADAQTVRLFSYGTLQQAEVQRATYGRLLEGAADGLRGYRLEPLTITDPKVVRLSGKAVHTIACHSGDPADRISGLVFLLTEDELTATDRYEVDAYARVEVMLDSGTKAFVYVGPGRPLTS
ncbi:MAG: gamma-glutamylcyclotransferase family protein [Sphingomicrobium sp.]